MLVQDDKLCDVDRRGFSELLNTAMGRREDMKDSIRMAVMVAGMVCSFIKYLGSLVNPASQFHADVFINMVVACLCHVDCKCERSGLWDKKNLDEEVKRWMRIRSVKFFTNCVKKGAITHNDKKGGKQGEGELTLGEHWSDVHPEFRKAAIQRAREYESWHAP